MIDPYQVRRGARAGRRLHPADHGLPRRRAGGRAGASSPIAGAWTCWSRCTTTAELERALEDRQRPDRRQQPQPQDARRRPRDDRAAGAPGAEGPRAGGRERPRLAGRSRAHGEGRRLGVPDRRELHAQARRRGAPCARSWCGRRHEAEDAHPLRQTAATPAWSMSAPRTITERVASRGPASPCRPATLKLIRDKKAAKGDVLAVAQLAGIMAAKKTPDLIPLCHPLALIFGRRQALDRRQAPRRRHRGDLQAEGPHRRRDGSADRRLGRRPDRLRHVQGGRSRHGDLRRQAAAQIGRQVGNVRCPLRCFRSRRRTPGDRGLRQAAGRDGLGGRGRRPRAGRRAAGAADPAAGRSLGDGRLRRAGRGRAGRADDADPGRRGAGRRLLRSRAEARRDGAHLHRRAAADGRRLDRDPGRHQGRRQQDHHPRCAAHRPPHPQGRARLQRRRHALSRRAARSPRATWRWPRR